MIYKEDGLWSVRLDKKDKLTGKRVQIHKRGFTTKREAQKYVNDLDAPVSPSITFKEVSERYLNSLESAPETAQAKRAMWRILFPMYEKPIADIDRDALDQWRTWLSKEDYSDETKRKTLRAVRSVFKYYFQIYGLPDTVTMVLKPFKKKRKEEVMQIWTPEEFKKFVDCVDGYVYQVFFEFLYWCGMRRGECMGLRKACLDGNRLTINASIKHFKNGLKSTKNEASERTITISDYLLERVKPLMDLPGEFIFGGDTTLPISNLQRRHDAAIKESGVRPIRIHDLRHSHASFLISNGFDVTYVSKRLGHATVQQTLQTYTHLFEHVEKENDKKLNKIINKSYQNPTAQKVVS